MYLSLIIPDKHMEKRFFLGVSVFWLICCVALLIPSTHNLIISFVEFIVNRSLDHSYWHKAFVTNGICGIILYIIFAWLFFAAFHSSKIASKTLDIFVMTISLIFAFFIMYKAGWVLGDDHEYITSTAINKYVPTVQFGGGRFMPFRYIEYNLPLFVFRCLGINTGLPVEAHFVVISLLYIVTVFCLYFLFRRITPIEAEGMYLVFNCFFACTFLLLSNSFSWIFLDLVFPETQVIMLFSIFMLMYYKALKTDNMRYYAIALLSAIYSTYCKEPVFGVFLIIAFANYLFRYKKSKLEKIFYIALVANGIIFIILYYFLSYKNATRFYNEGRVSIEGFKFLMSVFRGSPILIIMFAFGLTRLYSIIVRKNREYLFYDSLLFAGIGYVFAFFVLHLNADYYFLPSIILFLPSIVYWIKYSSRNLRVFSVALFIILLIYTSNCGQTIGQIRNILQERQEFMPYMIDLFSYHNEGKEFIWYESDNNIHRKTDKYRENVFLNYINKSEGIDFFVVEKNMDNITMDQNMLFFYPVENLPMKDKLVKKLRDNNFVLYKDAYGISIYKQH